MDVEDISNLTSDSNRTNDFSDSTIPRNIYWETFMTTFGILSLFCIAANILTIFAIYKFERLYRQASNVILLHLNVVELIFLLTTPLMCRVFYEFSRNLLFNYTVFCVSSEFNIVLTLSIVLFLLLLITDWYIKTYKENSYPKFCKIYKYCIFFIYVFSVLLITVLAQLCHRNIYTYSELCVALILFLSLLLVIVMNVIHQIKRRKVPINERKHKNNIGLAIANIFFLSWSVNLLLIILGLSGVQNNVLTGIFTAFGFLSPVWNFCYLYKCDDDFHVFYLKIFTCQCNKYVNDQLSHDIISYRDARNVKTEEENK